MYKISELIMNYQEFSTIFLNTIKIFKNFFFSFDEQLARRHYKKLMAFILMPIFNVKSINQIHNQKIKDGLYNFFKNNSDTLDALTFLMFCSFQFLCYWIDYLKTKSSSVQAKNWIRIIIDDSDTQKFGKMMQCISTFFSHGNQRYIDGFQYVAIFISIGDKVKFPVAIKLYPPKTGISKLDIAQHLLQQLFSQLQATNLWFPKHSLVLFDSWYLSKKLVAFLNQHQLKYLGKAKSNWKYRFYTDLKKYIPRNQLSIFHKFYTLFMNWTQFMVSSVLQLTPSAVRSQWPSALYVSRVKVYHRTMKHTLLIYDKRINENKIYLTTAYELNTASIIIFYSERWDIESFFRDTKQHLNLQDFGFQKFNANQIYLCFRLLSYYFLVLFRQSKPFLNRMTIGQLKNLINHKFYKIAQHYSNQFDKVIFHYLR